MRILEKLTSRRAERQKENAASWSQFVADTVDERTIDPDEILTGLDRLQKTPEDLQLACELLLKRRAWARQAAAGDAAEQAYGTLTAQAAAAENEIEKLIEDHAKKQRPLADKIEAAQHAIGVAADARRRLLDTAGDESRRSAVDAIDAEMSEVQAEHQGVLKALRDRERWVAEVSSHGDAAATEDIQRLPAMRSELPTMKKRDAELRGKLTELQSRRGAAAESLLKPEAI